jgi:hypothetical protein
MIIIPYERNSLNIIILVLLHRQDFAPYSIGLVAISAEELVPERWEKFRDFIIDAIRSF